MRELQASIGENQGQMSEKYADTKIFPAQMTSVVCS